MAERRAIACRRMPAGGERLALEADTADLCPAAAAIAPIASYRIRPRCWMSKPIAGYVPARRAPTVWKQLQLPGTYVERDNVREKKARAFITTGTHNEERFSCRHGGARGRLQCRLLCAVARDQWVTWLTIPTITTRVKARLVEDKIVAATRISVETLKGVVQLSGFAVSEAERVRAAQIAASVPGVKQVQNAITVRPVT